MGESLSQNLDTDAAIAGIAGAGIEVAEAQAVIVFARDETSGEFALAGRSGDPELDIALDAPLLQGVLEGVTIHVANIEDLPGDGETASDGRLPRSVLACPIFLRSGQVGGFIVFLKATADGFDIVNQRVAGGLARWSGIVLENARLYSQSQGVQELLREANVAKDEFLAIVSHELRTPITTIYGGTRLLRLRRDKLPEEAINDMFESIAEEAENLYRLVEDLLAIARTEMSEAIEREPVLMANVIEQAVSNFARTSNHEVLVRISPDLPVALGEPTYLNQVVTNLLSNAHKYSPAELPIEVEAEGADDAVIVRVMDRGTGVPAEELDQIFERFYRSRSTAERASGKGLGLTVCKRLVEAISGEIWAENRPDSGLIVNVKLEAAESLPEQAEVSSPASGAVT
jgi:K+-sensing histidine kinase KdpD